MKVFWTETAEYHLDAIYSYISLDSPEYAKQTVDRITRRSIQMADFPLSGRKVPEYEMEQIREVFEGLYRIIYFVKPDQIDILAVIHIRVRISKVTIQINTLIFAEPAH